MNLTTLHFSKYHGLGNDFVICDCRDDISIIDLFLNSLELRKKILNRNYGIGGDGLIFILPSVNQCSCRMRIFNSDGTEAEMCGNGIRCLVSYIVSFSSNLNSNEFIIETKAGKILANYKNANEITVDMGRPILEPSLIPTSFLDNLNGVPYGSVNVEGDKLEVFAAGMGNPHAAVYVENPDSIPFDSWGQSIEHASSFPAHTNVHFIKIIDLETLSVRVWERGSGPTLACGTGACASLVISYLLGKCRNKAKVILPGGNLYISWPNFESSVFMTGPAIRLFDGTYYL